jgi:hypothetical protein
MAPEQREHRPGDLDPDLITVHRVLADHGLEHLPTLEAKRAVLDLLPPTSSPPTRFAYSS